MPLFIPARRVAPMLAAALVLRATGISAQEARQPNAPVAPGHDDSSHASCADWHQAQGRYIDSISVVTAGVGHIGPFDWLRFAHMTTRPDLVRDAFGVRAGAPLDTAELQYGLRRVRALDLFADVQLSVASCAGPGIHLRLQTTDRWTETVQARYASGPGLSLLVTERSVLGRGISVSAGFLADNGRLAPSAVVRDPLLFHGTSIAALSGTRYADGAVVGLTFVPTSAVSASDWLLWGRVSSSHRAVPRDTALVLTPKDSAALLADTLGNSLDSTYAPITEGYSLVRSSANVLVGRRIASIPLGRVYLLAGVERVTADLHVAPEQLTLGAQDVERFFVGPTAGVALRATDYTDIAWYVSAERPLQLPRGLEMDVVLSRGHETVSDLPMTHLDSWLGVTLTPAGLGLLTLDWWSSGYRSEGVVSNGTTRARVGWIHPTSAGRWLLRLGWEDITNPDPDVHALTTFDPIRQVISPRSNLAESARTLLVEHDWRLPITVMHHPFAVALFGAASRRHGTLSESAVDPTYLQGAVLGFGPRLWPAVPSEGMIELNVGYPLVRSAIGGTGWFASLQVTPGPGTGRGRQ